MADNRWNTPTPSKGRRRGFSLWFTLPLAILGGIAILVFAMVGRATGLERQAWPLVQAVHKRISTDEGARELLRMNPACAQGYASEAAFLDAVREWRPKIGPLPAVKPSEGRESFLMDSDPFELTVAIRGTGGGWLRARFVTGPAAVGQNVGEGLTSLVFADTHKEVRQAAQRARKQILAKQWVEFHGLIGRLATDESALALVRAEPVLRQGWSSEAAFLQDARAWRPFIAAVPAASPDPEKEDDAQRVEIYTNESPLGSSREIRYLHPGGVWKVAWRNGTLESIQHRPR